MKRLQIVITAALLVCLTPAIASAQTSQADPAEVERRYAEAIEAFKAARYEEAARAFLEVHSMAPAAILLYNAAYAFGRSERYVRALEEAERAELLGLRDPEVETRNRARMLGWKGRLAAQSVAGDLKEVGTRPPGQSPGGPAADDGSTLPWVAGATTLVGAGLLVGAAVTSAAVDDDVERLEASRTGPRDEYDAALAQVEERQQIGQILEITGAVFAVGGLVMWTWWFLEDGGESEASVGLSPTGVQVRGSF